MSDVVPRPTHESYADAGLWIQLEAPDQVNALLLAAPMSGTVRPSGLRRARG